MNAPTIDELTAHLKDGTVSVKDLLCLTPTMDQSMLIMQDALNQIPNSDWFTVMAVHFGFLLAHHDLNMTEYERLTGHPLTHEQKLLFFLAQVDLAWKEILPILSGAQKAH